MSQRNMSDIFAHLPKDYQKIGLLGALEQMFASGEWGWIEEAIPGLLAVDEDSSFMARIVSLGVRVALRMKNYALAFERQRLFWELELNPEIAMIQAETLMQLAIQLLPAMADNLCALWVKSLSSDMPLSAQEIAAKTGVMLAEAFIKSRNRETALYIKDTMTENLAENIWRKASYKMGE